MLQMLKTLLKPSGYDITTAQCAENALRLIESERFDFILCDIKMPQMGGLEFLRICTAKNQPASIVMMSAYGTINLAIECLHNGATDFISKPFKKNEVLRILKKAERNLSVASSDSLPHQFGNLIFNSPEMAQCVKIAQKAALYPSTVAITGESGTGKELLARAIHENSSRKDKPFCAINCATINDTLLESELYGHKKGAFTDAQQPKKGIFSVANEGTLLLDEIADMTPALQVSLLRVLQEGEIRPVGQSSPIPIDVRVITSSSRSLEASVQAGQFREDLYYRLNVIPIRIPPLRERISDLDVLCPHIIKNQLDTIGDQTIKISQPALNVLRKHSWPGNIRELQNVLQRALIFVEGEIIEENHIEDILQSRGITDEEEEETNIELFSLKTASKKLEAQLISRALAKSHGNKSKAARLLEISYPSLLHKIKEYDL